MPYDSKGKFISSLCNNDNHWSNILLMKWCPGTCGLGREPVRKMVRAELEPIFNEDGDRGPEDNEGGNVGTESDEYRIANS